MVIDVLLLSGKSALLRIDTRVALGALRASKAESPSVGAPRHGRVLWHYCA